MTDQEKNELNRKLAKWAGFTFETKGSGEKIGKLFEMDVVDVCEIVNYPDGGWDLVGDMPNFTQSLDACFEYLVPKLKELHLDLEILIDSTSIHPTLVEIIPAFGNPDVGGAVSEENDPTLALCLAIQEIIDEGT